jgi:lysophospholipase L1-like esterase
MCSHVVLSALFLLQVPRVIGENAEQDRGMPSFTSRVVDVVYIGDSITEGAGLPDPASQAPPVICTDLLRTDFRGVEFFSSNQGRSGRSTADVLPTSSQEFEDVEKATKELKAEHPGQIVFSIMLGTNDSAESGPTGSPISPDKYGENLRRIISQLLIDFPNSIVVLHRPTWYSPNTNNGAVYEKKGLARLKAYFPMIDAISMTLSSNGERVFRGDTFAFKFFALNYRSDFQAELGQKGLFYLHPNVTGAKELARFWAAAIGKAINSR